MTDISIKLINFIYNKTYIILEIDIVISYQPEMNLSKYNLQGRIYMAKDIITYADFDKIEFKLGVIVACEKHPNADRLLVFQVDVGEETPRQIVSSIAEFYNPEEVINKRVVVVTNLKPAKFRGLESNGMLMCASLVDDEDVELLTITKPFIGGTRVD